MCPNHVLHGLSESKKRNLRALSINNATYKRAMEISPFNEGKTLADVDPTKTWEDGTAAKLRPDSHWYDDRYKPSEHPHSHRFDANNFPNQEYVDFFGGNLGVEDRKKRDAHGIGFIDSFAKALGEKMQDIAGAPDVETPEQVKEKKYL